MKVSVVMPCFNRETVVAETIRCLLAQTRQPDEIIAVDDGSTDRTVEVLESFGPRIKILRQPNGGPSAARNAGLSIAKGEYVWFMDSDDIASLNKLEDQIEVLERERADIGLCPWIRGGFKLGRFEPESTVLQQYSIPRSDTLAAVLLSDWSTILQSALFRRDFLLKLGGFDESYVIAEDTLLFVQCSCLGARVVHTPNSMVLYRTNGPTQLTKGGSTSERRTIDWIRYLLAGRAACVNSGREDPLSRLTYRLRLWSASVDLKRFDTAFARSLGAEAACLLTQRRPPLGYSATKRLNQSLMGLRRRFQGGKDHPSYACGSLTSAQVKLIRELGYSVDTTA
jgi:glycosyltransferase involved in cell wall biosynthesis